METLGADTTTHLATHATTTEIVGMTGVIIVEMTDVTGVTNEETIDAMDTDMIDVTGATVIISGLGDN